MNKEDRKDLVERLRNISRGDHERGCQGREYVCSCDYDETSWKTAEEAAAEIDRLRRELEEHQAAKWKEKHVDTMNDMAALRIALEGVEAQLSDARRELEEARRQAFKEAAEIAESQAPKEINGQWSPYRAWVLRAAAAIRKCAEEEGK